MPCIHGLDEISCPTCRIIANSVPDRLLKLKDLYKNELKPQHPYLHLIKSQKNILPSNMPNLTGITPPLAINYIPIRSLMTTIPEFVNKQFEERLKELDLGKWDIYGIKDKINLANPEWNFEDKE
ncbi:MAG: hypothetical protein ACTSVV_03785 [Promethearchaeota archaeon]